MQELNHFLESAVPSSPFPERLDAIISELRAIRASMEATKSEGLAAYDSALLVGISERLWWQKNAARNPRSDSHQ